MNRNVTTEDTFTPSNDWCPSPNYWHSLDSEATEVEVTDFVYAWVRVLQPELVVETGTFMGDTALAIGKALQHNQHGNCVTHEINAELFGIASDRVKDVPVTCVLGKGVDWVPSQPIDFAWFDSGYDSRAGEILHYLQYFSSGAIFGVHDTAPHHSIRRTLDKVVAGLPEIHLRTPRGVSFFQVP